MSNDETERAYVVRWEIDVTASSPREAAQQAARAARDPESTATFYDVLDPADESLIEQVEVPHHD
jgi:hypothetical protein